MKRVQNCQALWVDKLWTDKNLANCVNFMNALHSRRNVKFASKHSFLAAQDSSIGDLVTHSLTDTPFDFWFMVTMTTMTTMTTVATT